MTNRDSIVIFAQDGKFYIRFPYNERVINKVKDSIPDVRFNRPLLAWVAPFRSLPEILKFSEATGATMDWGSYDYKDVLAQYSNYSGGVPRPRIFERVGKNKSLVGITFPYHPELFSATLNLPCAGKTTTKKYGTHWVVPTSDAARLLTYIDRYNAECSVDLRAKLEELASRQAVLMDKSWSIEPEERYDFYHNTERSLYSYQKAASEYLLDTKRCILGEKMGVGKSGVAIASLGTADAFPALVVVPKSAKYVWNDYELPVWMSQKSTQVLSGTKANEEIVADIVIINYDILWHWKDKLSEVGFRCVIVDEAHALANTAAKRTQAAKQICEGVEYVWFLTGTALTNRPTELIGVLDALGVLQTLFVNASTFKNRYEADRGVVSNVEELTRILRGNCFIRRAGEDLHAPIPVVRSFLPVDTDAAVMRDYKEAEKDIVEFVGRKAAELAEELGEDPHSAAVRARLRAQAGEVMVRLSRLRKLAGEAKIPGTIKFLDEYMEQYPDEKILLFGYHRENLQTYQKHFRCKIIQGGVSDADRAAAIRGIQDGDDRIVCLQIRAAGEALTLTAAATCIFTEQDWSPMRMLQAEARSARLGQTSNVMVFFTVADGTIDLKLFNTLQSKYATCLAIMDGKSPDTLTYIESSTEDELLNNILEKYNG